MLGALKPGAKPVASIVIERRPPSAHGSPIREWACS